MAIGIGEMFGIYCPENFDYPYMTGSISEFWRRWHISLGRWFKDYIYIPLGGSRVNSKKRLYLNLLIVWSLTGLWHGAKWQFVFWGLGYFVMIAFEKTTGWPKKFKRKFSKVLYRCFTLAFINFQWVIFRSNSLKKGFEYIKNMFTASNRVADIRAVYLLNNYAVIIFCSVLLCFPIIPFINTKLANSKLCDVWEIGLGLVISVLFVCAVAFAVVTSSNPFAYANF